MKRPLCLALFCLYAVSCAGDRVPVSPEEEALITPRDSITGIVRGAEPLSFEGNDTGVLVLHGFTGSPSEVGPLACALAACGYTVRAPLLPGHGRRPADLDTVTVEDWKQCVTGELAELRRTCSRVYLAGFSLGGALAAWKAQQAPESMDGLVLVAPWFRIRYKWYYILSPERWARIVEPFRDYIFKTKVGNVNREAGRESLTAYRFFPLSAVIRADGFTRIVMEHAPDVHVPTLVLHSRNDETVSYRASRAFFEQIPVADKTFKPYTRSNHLLFLDYDADAAIQAIIAWIRGERT